MFSNYKWPSWRDLTTVEYSNLGQYPDNLTISAEIYEYVYNYKFPLITAFTYFVSVHAINSIIRKKQIAQYYAANGTGKKPTAKELKPVPTAISKTKPFKFFVLIHNALLAVYSFGTFVLFLTALFSENAKFAPVYYQMDPQATQTLAGTLRAKQEIFWHSICDLQSVWVHEPSFIGVSYLGYFFYLSKFYEILDTIIILLKGRPSSLLQSYHHTGAILSMFAGMKFLAPPIWIFVCFNSFIHSLMYTYYVATQFVTVPKILKRALTTLQITQFLVGGSLAVLHLFVTYIDADGIRHPCINNLPQALAVYLNVFYLVPLTKLFVSFWIKSYKGQIKQKTQ